MRHFPNVICSDLSVITSFSVKVNLCQRLEDVSVVCRRQFLEIDFPVQSVWDPEYAQVKRCERLCIESPVDVFELQAVPDFRSDVFSETAS